MNGRRWLRGFRLFWGLVLAPAVVPVTLFLSLQTAVTRFGLDRSDVVTAALHTFVLTFGAGLVYLSVLCFGLPYIVLLSRAGRLNFRTIMLPTGMLSWVYCVVIYASLHGDYPFAGTVAAICVPGVLLSGLLFYVIALWRSGDADAEISLLLEAYPTQRTPTLPA
ncbi:MAG: hypothetical protein FJ280_22935 [Planctomycetes bacterium]|nr:hypothetical protein [Planctomycetota bacterium]